VQALDAGETLTDTHTFTASDGSTQVVTITINGAEDAPVIGGSFTGTVAEDGAATATGALSITDTDTGDNPVGFPDETATAGDNGYGNFVLTGGTWTYSLNNAHGAVQALGAGQTLTDTHTFTASDGSTQVVTITINGADESSDDNSSSGIDPDIGINDPGTDGQPSPDEEEVPPAAHQGSAGLPRPSQPDSDNPMVLNSTTEKDLLPEILFLEDETGDTRNERFHNEMDQKVYLDQSVKVAFASTENMSVDQGEDRFDFHKVGDGQQDGQKADGVNIDYDQLRKEIDESYRSELKRQFLNSKIVSATGAIFTAGLVSYLLRAGSLIASLMSSIPLWRGYDPIAILAGKTKKRKDQNRTTAENDNQTETLFKGEDE
jgi:VCBS repeat-containing protein